MKDVLKRAVNGFLGPFGLQVVRLKNGLDLKPWDEEFLRWISEAERLGQDPNDVGDLKWEGNSLAGMEEYLFPHLSDQSVVLEFGPGTGRCTRHVITRCKSMILVDYSAVVCDWLNRYLQGKGSYSVHKIGNPILRDIGDGAADVGFAAGVFEHIDLDDAYEFFREFYRVLRSGGIFWFNFDTIVTPGGLEWFRQERTKLGPGVRSIFRFHHPEDIKRLAEMAGFSVKDVHIANDRLISIHLEKPAL